MRPSLTLRAVEVDVAEVDSEGAGGLGAGAGQLGDGPAVLGEARDETGDRSDRMVDQIVGAFEVVCGVGEGILCAGDVALGQGVEAGASACVRRSERHRRRECLTPRATRWRARRV